MPSTLISKMSLTPVQQFYSGQTIFLTGSTGFVGKLIIEKLLRACYDIEKLYILVRVKKNKTAEQRYEEIFDHACFDRLKYERPDFKNKVELVEGDCEMVNLGLSDHNIQKLVNEVTCVFHGAATLRFDEKLRKAANINVRAVRYILRLARQMSKLKAFVHISTAFSHCVQGNIDEQFYETPMNVDSFLDAVDAVDDKTLSALTHHLLGKWPNTYVFTKAIAEEVIRKEGVGLPLAIVRPTIILSTVSEPIPGWLDNFYNLAGLTLACELGIIRFIYLNPTEIPNVMPCDFVVNNVLCAAWNIEDEKISAVKVKRDEKSQIPIYNMASPENSLIPLSYFFDVYITQVHKYPSNKMIYRFCKSTTGNLMWFRFWDFFIHTVPAYLIDLVLIIMRRKPLAVKGYQKLNRLLELLMYFRITPFNFKIGNVRQLLDKLSEDDQRVFSHDMGYFDWPTYLSQSFIAARVHMLKDPMDTVPQAKKKLVYFIYLDYFIKATFFYFVFNFVCVLFNRIFF